MPIDLILGTAGHIDHGKTSLIRALTGVDTDRLPEEQKRGITIELGFAHLELDEFRLGIVDVPGHERFVRNMLAGATGMDLAMLVVAADDSVKPQTREHLDVLRLLDLPAGLIVLTKTDLADPEWVDLVESEVRELVQATFLERAKIVRSSAATGVGLDDVRQALIEVARQAHQARLGRPTSEVPFRMAIDRTFSIAGHGTVVTGSVTSGETRVGDQMRIEPGGIEVRVRGLQNHDQMVDLVHRGQRAAMNLAGVRHDDIRRGHEVTSVGFLVPSRLLTVRLSLLGDAPRALKNRSRVRIHIGTAELTASVVLLDQERLAPGEEAWAQFFLSEAAVSTWNQPFVVRFESPAVTIGGGRVAVPNARKVRQPNDRTFEQLGYLFSDEPTKRASAALYFSDSGQWQESDLVRTAGIDDPPSATEELKKRGDLVEIELSPRRVRRIHRLVMDEICDQVESHLAKAHQREPLRSLLALAPVKSRINYLGDAGVVDAVLARMRREGRLRLTERGIGLAGYGPKLSANERKLLALLIQQYKDAGFQPPTIKDCITSASKNRDSVESLIHLAATDGDLVQINSDFFLHTERENEMRSKLEEAMRDGEGLTMSQIREILGTSRKYAVPFCEYLDRVGFTRRDGDTRILAN